MGATYLIGYTEKEQQQQQNRIERQRERERSQYGDRERERSQYGDTERGFRVYTRQRKRVRTDTIPYRLAGRVAGLRHLENTGMSYKVPEAQVKLKTQLYPQHRSAPENS